jgi:HK97 family phage portal protein
MHDEPNDWMTAFVWFESLMASTLATGNGYSYLERRNDGTVANALLLDSGKIEPVIVDGQKKYSYRLKQNILLDDADVIHVTGLSFNGLVGLSPIH